MSTCPYCGAEVPTMDEIAHMTSTHPDIINRRRGEIGEEPLPPNELHRVTRLFNRLEAAITHHKKRHQPEGLLFAESADEALWKVRDQILSEYHRGEG